MNNGVFIPIRLDSERLPEKSLKLVNEKPILYYLFDRILKSESIQSKKKIVVCTTENKSDDKLESVVKEYGANIFRGSKDDLIQRFYDANKFYKFNNIFLIDGDDPLIFPEHLDLVLNEQKKFDCIYTSELPFGLNVKSVTAKGINKVYESYLSKFNDTGFGLYFTNSGIIKAKKINVVKSHPLLLKARLTLDYLEDFELMKKIINDLYLFDNSDYSFKTFEDYIVKNSNILKLNLFRHNQYMERSISKINLKYKKKDKILKINY